MNFWRLMLFVFLSSGLGFVPAMGRSEPLFANSVVSHNVDLIAADDPTVQATINFMGSGRREMPDRRHDQLIDKNAYLFRLNFTDNSVVRIWAHSDFKTQKEAEPYVGLIANSLGKLPRTMRKTLSHVVLHQGNEGAFAEHLGHFFVLYSKNIYERFEQNDLEETVFHESVHATLDNLYASSSDWLQAQKADGRFVTRYAEQNPNKEDLAETALFAFSLFNNPTRMPDDVRQWLEDNVPGRIEFLFDLFESFEQ